MSTVVLLTITGLGLAAMYFLVASGLSADRIDITSEGKRDAKGNQPVVVEGPNGKEVDPSMPRFTYGYDRRVDVVVTGGAHHP